MPLRDHFRPPLDDRTSWDGFHGQWPSMIVMHLFNRLPGGYVAAPHVHLGSSIEVDVATYEGTGFEASRVIGDDPGGGVATAVWAPPRPTLATATHLADLDEYEVRVFDTKRGRRLVAAVEIVSPANKDRPEHRRAFLAKCLGLIQNQVSVTIVDVVTTRTSNLYGDLLEFCGLADPSLAVESPTLYGATCRVLGAKGGWTWQSWAYPLTLGQGLPTLPLWLSGDLAVPLELEASYEETCRILRIA